MLMLTFPSAAIAFTASRNCYRRQLPLMTVVISGTVDVLPLSETRRGLLSQFSISLLVCKMTLRKRATHSGAVLVHVHTYTNAHTYARMHARL